MPLFSKLVDFIKNECRPAEDEFEEKLEGFKIIPEILLTLQRRAKELGIWNLFMTHVHHITVHDYGLMSEQMGTSFLAAYATNCAAPDTGNMEVLHDFGTPAQKQRYLNPLMEGSMRSAFLMTEPDVASSDARNVCTEFKKETRNGVEGYVISGRKWWSTGAEDPRCGVFIVMGRVVDKGEMSKYHTMLVVPAQSLGITLVRSLTVFGYDDAPFGHAEISLEDVWVSQEDALLSSEGCGFKIAQSRLGPGRIHHCMRAIGLARRCFEIMVERMLTRKVFGKEMARHGMSQEKIADCKSDLDCARAIVLLCADKIDRIGAKAARGDISMIKYAVPDFVLRIVDKAMQVHGGMGMCEDTMLPRAYSYVRTLRIADGPDEVHKMVVAREECKAALKRMGVEVGAATRSKL
ncbi:hypothetical protein TrLO_g9657 [Triparma laevis f. longispina]|nr:hypothetical protein TrLO_g9657 [Triparma laevis f. longispina]